MNENLIMDSYDKNLLMNCINSSIEKIEFVLRNASFYGINSFIIESFKDDLTRLKKLQIQIFSIEITIKESL